MERFFNKSTRVILLIILVLTIIGIATSSFAATIYTGDLKKGMVLSFDKGGATAWSVYKTAKLADVADGNSASKYLKAGDKITINLIKNKWLW